MICYGISNIYPIRYDLSMPVIDVSKGATDLFELIGLLKKKHIFHITNMVFQWVNRMCQPHLAGNISQQNQNTILIDLSCIIEANTRLGTGHASLSSC